MLTFTVVSSNEAELLRIELSCWCLINFVSSLYGLFLQGRCESITFVKLLSCFDDLVAVGTASGRVAVFQLVSSLPGRNKQVNLCIWLNFCEV